MLTSTLGLLAAAAVLFPVNAAGADPGDTAAAVAVARQSKRPPAGRSIGIAIESGGLERRYLLRLPRGHDHGTPLPVVFDFHGSGSDPREELQVSAMDRAADRNGFALLMPVAVVPNPGGGRTWNVPPEQGLADDVLFAMDVLDNAARRVPIDPTRVYMTGFSGGVRLASELACAAPGRVAALAAVGGLRSPAACDGQPVPVIAFHGTDDPINPYTGGGADYWSYGVEDAVRGWVKRNGCDAAPQITRLSPVVEERAYGGCRAAAEVVLYRVAGAGHTWPGSAFPFPEERFGASEPGLDATALIMRFFARHAAATGRRARAARPE